MGEGSCPFLMARMMTFRELGSFINDHHPPIESSSKKYPGTVRILPKPPSNSHFLRKKCTENFSKFQKNNHPPSNMMVRFVDQVDHV